MNAPPNEGINVAATVRARKRGSEAVGIEVVRVEALEATCAAPERDEGEATASTIPPDAAQTAALLTERPAANDSVPAPSAVRNMLTSALEALMSGGLTEVSGVPIARVLLELSEVESAWVSAPRDVRQREKALARLREAQKSAERVAAAVSRLRKR